LGSSSSCCRSGRQIGLIEAVLGTIIIVIVGLLGTMAPGSQDVAID
jgi:hypothetical protein